MKAKMQNPIKQRKLREIINNLQFSFPIPHIKILSPHDEIRAEPLFLFHFARIFILVAPSHPPPTNNSSTFIRVIITGYHLFRILRVSQIILLKIPIVNNLVLMQY